MANGTISINAPMVEYDTIASEMVMSSASYFNQRTHDIDATARRSLMLKSRR